MSYLEDLCIEPFRLLGSRMGSLPNSNAALSGGLAVTGICQISLLPCQGDGCLSTQVESPICLLSVSGGGSPVS